MKKTPLKKIGKKKLEQGNIYSTFNKPRAKIKPISNHRAKELKEYSKLKARLIELCGNKSELSGIYGVECHHIDGRENKLLLNPFNIICVTRTEHDIEQGKIKGDKHSKQELLAIVKKFRLSQGFKEEDYK